MNPFYDQRRIFVNTARASDVEIQSRKLRPDMLSHLGLGHLLQYPLHNQYATLYGHPLEKRAEPEVLKPPIEANKAFWSSHPIPFTIIQTNNKLVDVAGTYYYNKELPIVPR